VLKLLAPINPMLTYKIYATLRGKDIHFEKFPTVQKTKTSIATSDIIEINSKIWKAKKEKGLSLKVEIKKAFLPEKFKIIEKDLTSTHNILNVQYGKELAIEF